MRRFLLKIAFFLTLYVVFYLAFFFAVDQGIKHSNYRDFAEWNEIQEGEINADLLVQGSSRAWRQVDPAILDSILGTDSYNLGIDGYQIPMQLAKYQLYRKHNVKPKHIVYIVDHFSFARRDNLFNMEQFLPYAQNDILEDELKRYDGLSWPDYVVPYYSYIGSKQVTLAGLSEFLGVKSFEKDKYKGFRASTNSWEPEFDIEFESNRQGKYAPFSAEVYKQFDDFLQNCRNEGIDVTVVYSPEYVNFQQYIVNRDTISSLFRIVTEKNHFQYIDYKDHFLCRDKMYFYNPTHLNALGSKIFTEDLAKQISIPERAE